MFRSEMTGIFLSFVYLIANPIGGECQTGIESGREERRAACRRLHDEFADHRPLASALFSQLVFTAIGCDQRVWTMLVVAENPTLARELLTRYQRATGYPSLVFDLLDYQSVYPPGEPALLRDWILFTERREGRMSLVGVQLHPEEFYQHEYRFSEHMGLITEIVAKGGIKIGASRRLLNSAGLILFLDAKEFGLNMHKIRDGRPREDLVKELIWRKLPRSLLNRMTAIVPVFEGCRHWMRARG